MPRRISVEKARAEETKEHHIIIEHHKRNRGLKAKRKDNIKSI